jgi:hypothetical protein
MLPQCHLPTCCHPCVLPLTRPTTASAPLPCHHVQHCHHTTAAASPCCCLLVHCHPRWHGEGGGHGVHIVLGRMGRASSSGAWGTCRPWAHGVRVVLRCMGHASSSGAWGMHRPRAHGARIVIAHRHRARVALGYRRRAHVVLGQRRRRCTILGRRLRVRGSASPSRACRWCGGTVQASLHSPPSPPCHPGEGKGSCARYISMPRDPVDVPPWRRIVQPLRRSLAREVSSLSFIHGGGRISC